MIGVPGNDIRSEFMSSIFRRSLSIKDAKRRLMPRLMRARVGVGNENMADAHELARGQRRHVAKIEEKRPAAEAKVDEQRGIREGIIDEPRLYEPGHSIPLRVRPTPGL
jgi:hypothetical protein